VSIINYFDFFNCNILKRENPVVNTFCFVVNNNANSSLENVLSHTIYYQIQYEKKVKQ
jgi:hypothetical protein